MRQKPSRSTHWEKVAPLRAGRRHLHTHLLGLALKLVGAALKLIGVLGQCGLRPRIVAEPFGEATRAPSLSAVRPNLAQQF
jgi:hypothetical protein